MKNFRKFIGRWGGGFAAALALILLPTLALAETVVRTGDTVSIAAGQVVEQDFYAYGGNVTHTGEVIGDMYAVAGSVTVNGEVGADLTVVSGSVQVHSDIGDDLRVVGGETILAGKVQGDVFVIGGLLKILSSAEVKGNVYFYGGKVDVEGAVAGSLLGRAEEFSVNGNIEQDIDIAGTLLLGDRAAVGGDVRYQSSEELTRAQNASVVGEINYSPLTARDQDQGSWWLLPALVWAFTTLGTYLFLRNSLEKFVTQSRDSLGKSGLLGLGAIILLPVLATILMVTVLGFWFGALALLAWLLLLLIAFILLPVFVGYYLFVLFKKKRRLDVLTVLAGIVAVTVLLVIPFLGSLALFVGVAIVAGYLTFTLYRVSKRVL